MLFSEKHGAFVQNKQNFQHFKGFCLLTERNNKTCEIAKSLITQTIVSIIRDSKTLCKKYRDDEKFSTESPCHYYQSYTNLWLSSDRVPNLQI